MRLFMPSSSQVLDTLEDRASMNSLGSQLQYLAALMVKDFWSIKSMYLNLYLNLSFLIFRTKLHTPANS